MTYLQHTLIILLLSISCFSFGGNMALVIVDMQPRFVKQNGYKDFGQNPEKLKKVLARQVELIEMAKASGVPIIVVEYYSMGATHKAITNAIGNYHRTHTLVKFKDGFLQEKTGIAKSLNRYFESNSINHLLIAGANARECVKCGITGALDSAYRVTTDRNAIIDFNSKHFSYPFFFEPGPDYPDTKALNHEFTQPETAAEIDRLFVKHSLKTDPHARAQHADPSTLKCSRALSSKLVLDLRQLFGPGR